MNFKIEIDFYISDGKWIIWEIHKNYSIDRFHARTKKECKQWLSIQ